jgi:hypothetical protein
MNDEEITELAEKVKKEKYCSLYEKEHCKNCPLLQTGDGFQWCIDEDNQYKIPFIDGYKAAFDVLIEKIKSL